MRTHVSSFTHSLFFTEHSTHKYFYVHWNESTPQAGHAILRDSFSNTIDKSSIYLLVGGLVHQIGTDAIKGRHRAGHEKSCHEGTAKGSANFGTFPTGCNNNNKCWQE
jgi:hypothetical protein